MTSIYILPLIVVTLFFSPLSKSDEFLTNGYAIINNYDIDEARKIAFSNALANANHQSGITLFNADSIDTSYFDVKKLSVKSLLNTNKISIIKESIIDNHLKLDLVVSYNKPAKNDCQHSNLHSKILIPKTKLSDRKSLRYGNLNGFAESLSQQIEKTINHFSRKSKANSKSQLAIAEDAYNNASFNLKYLPTYIGEHQYILVPKITDMSLIAEPKYLLDFVINSPIRNFNINLALYHGSSGELIWQDDYQSQHKWNFDINETVNPSSDRFWKSDYGMGAKHLLLDAIQGIDKALDCRPVLGKVIAKNDKHIIINLGRSHGVKINHEFNLVLKQNIANQFDLNLPYADLISAKIRITQTTEHSSIAELTPDIANLNLQIGDIAFATETQ